MFDNTEARKHAEAEYPKESCGVITDEGVYLPIKNESSSPTQSFAINKIEYAKLLLQKKVSAFVHSHPNGPSYPSKADMESQAETGLAWGIIPVYDGKAEKPFFFGDSVEVPDLIGRPFRHGVTDCYSLIRDWYRTEKNVVLPVYPREWEWWKKGDSLYADNFEAAGFKRIPAGSSIKVGDVCLVRVRAKTPNHAGIYLGNGLVLHHLSARLGYDPSRLSCRDSVARWHNLIEYWVSYEGNTPTR